MTYFETFTTYPVDKIVAWTGSDGKSLCQWHNSSVTLQNSPKGPSAFLLQMCLKLKMTPLLLDLVTAHSQEVR